LCPIIDAVGTGLESEAVSDLEAEAVSESNNKEINLENYNLTDTNSSTIDPQRQEKIDFHRDLAAIYDPYPLRRVFQNVLVSIYGKDAQMVYYKLAKDDKLPKSDSQSEAEFNKNRDWLADLARNETRQNYLKQIMDTENVMLVSPNRFQLVDSHLGCWIIVNVDSYEMDGLELIQRLANSFYEKCSIGVADLSFPPNWRLISPLVDQTPSLLLKKSKTKIVKFEFRVGDWISYTMPVETWGKTVDLATNVEWKVNLDDFVKMAMEYLYNPMSETEKIEAIYSPIHVMNDENKEFMFNLIQAFYYGQNMEITANLAKDVENGIYEKDSVEMTNAWSDYIDDAFASDKLTSFLTKQLLETDEIKSSFITRLKPIDL
jgi:hypothetical protein